MNDQTRQMAADGAESWWGPGSALSPSPGSQGWASSDSLNEPTIDGSRTGRRDGHDAGS